MTDERTTEGRERDESLREVASTHAAALATQGGFKPQEKKFRTVEINWKLDEIKFQAVERDGDNWNLILDFMRSARECLGCLDQNDYVEFFKPWGKHLPEGAVWRLLLRKRKGRRKTDWIEFYREETGE